MINIFRRLISCPQPQSLFKPLSTVPQQYWFSTAQKEIDTKPFIKNQRQLKRKTAGTVQTYEKFYTEQNKNQHQARSPYTRKEHSASNHLLKQKKGERISFLKSERDFLQQNRLKQRKKQNQKKQDPQKYLLSSLFHLEGIKEFKSIQDKILIMDSNQISFQYKSRMIDYMKQLVNERQELISQELSQEWYHEQYQVYKQNQNSFISRYLKLYSQLRQVVDQILTSLQKSKSESIQVHSLILQIVKTFQIIESYQFYLEKILKLNRLQSRHISKHQFQLNLLIIDKLYQINFKQEVKLFPFDTLKQIGQFYKYKLPDIFSHNPRCSLVQKLLLLKKIEKILHQNILIYGKQTFYAEFLDQNLGQFQKILVDDHSSSNRQDINAFIDLFLFTVKSLILDPIKIQKLNFILEHLAVTKPQAFNPGMSLKIMQIYGQIGDIPKTVYIKTVAQLLYKKCQKRYYNQFAQCVKFFIYSNCDDDVFLWKFIPRLQSLIETYYFQSQNKLKHNLHFLVHYLTIKYPVLKQNATCKKTFSYCRSHTQKDIPVTDQIVNLFQQSLIKNNSCDKFQSPCINKTTDIIEKTYISQLSAYQQRLLGDNLKLIVNELNSSKKQFYELRENFSFCVLELDFVVLKWQSPKRQKLISYLNVESVGLNYSFDTYETKSEQENSKRLYSMSMIEYSKGLRFIRKKIVREEILTYYGWKVLYVPNKYTYTNLIDRQTLRNKMRQAILVKMSSKQ